MAETERGVLVYDRVESNRRNTLLLLALFALVLLPAVSYVAQYLAFVIGVFALGFGGLLSEDNWEAAVALSAVIAVGIVVAVAYFQYRYASALVLRIAGAREVEGEQEPELRRTVENLCIGAGLPRPRLYVVESSAANAFSTGLDPERASLVVTRGLLALLDRRELEGVVAQELSQIANYDVRLSTILAAGVGVLRLPFATISGLIRFLVRIHWLLAAGLALYLGLPLVASIPFGVAVAIGFMGSEPAAGVLLLLAMMLPFYVVLGAPALGLLIRQAVWRQREFLADADAVLLTRYAEGLARALAKMGAAGGLRTQAGGATAHLYIVDPLPEGAPWWDRVFSTHPPIEERIAALADMGGGIPPSVLREAEEAGARFRSAEPRAAAVGAVRRKTEPPAGDDMRSHEAAAPDEVGRAPVAFRLSGGGTTLYERPDTASTSLAQLADGALITVLETEGDFLRVLTADDSFGYIARSVAMTEVEIGG